MNLVFSYEHRRPAARPLAALVAIAGLHLLLGMSLLHQTTSRDNGRPVSRLDIVFIAPVIRQAVPVPPPAPPPPMRHIDPPGKPDIAARQPLPAPRQVQRGMDAVVQDPQPPVITADRQATPHAIDTAALISMAGRIDREVRPAGENLLSGTEGQSLRQKMDAAFAAAHLAVPLKWYEAARVELWSAPNDPKKIYQVTTAFGTYCLYYKDQLKDPNASGQPTMAGCPRRF